MTRSERWIVSLGCLGLVAMLCLVSAGSLWLASSGDFDAGSISTALRDAAPGAASGPDLDEPASVEEPSDEDPGEAPARAQERETARNGSGQGQGRDGGDPLRQLERDRPDVDLEALPLAGAQVAGSGQLTRLYEQANPGVVNIAVQRSLSVGGQEVPQLGGGSGYVYDDRHIVTNNHVVDGSSDIELIFFDGSRREAELVGNDAYSDLAVLRVVDALPDSVRSLPLEDDFDSLQVGQPAVAIGAPFGNTNSMTSGIISALGRSIPADLTGSQGGGSYSIPQSIQTDAAINPGNSGGPLLNLAGEVIGINAQINTLNQTPGVGASNSGVGFAIPASIVARVVPELIQNGRMTWAYLGVQGMSDTVFSVDVARANGLSEPIGAYIQGVPADGPSAGILRGVDEAASQAQGMPIGGDIVIEADGQRIESFDDLLTFIALDTRPGQTIELTVLRGGQEVEVEVVVGERPGA